MTEPTPCSTCTRVDFGQTGEYPCAECGLPSLHDAPEDPHMVSRRRLRDMADAFRTFIHDEVGTTGRAAWAIMRLNECVLFTESGLAQKAESESPQ